MDPISKIKVNGVTYTLGGKDGFTPTITATPFAGGTTFTITNADGTKSVSVLNGATGAPGFTPTITTSTAGVYNGISINITDVNGTKSVVLHHGEDGKDGVDGKDYVLTDADKQEIVEMVLAELEGGGGSGGTVNWLFTGEEVTTAHRKIVDMEPGVSYTAFVNGVEVATITKSPSGTPEAFINYEISPPVYLCYDADGNWSFEELDSQVKTGKVSVRING